MSEIRVLSVRMMAGQPMVKMGRFDNAGPGDHTKSLDAPVASHSVADIRVRMEQWAVELGKQEDDAQPIPTPVVPAVPVPRRP